MGRGFSRVGRRRRHGARPRPPECAPGAGQPPGGGAGEPRGGQRRVRHPGGAAGEAGGRAGRRSRGPRPKGGERRCKAGPGVSPGGLLSSRGSPTGGPGEARRGGAERPAGVEVAVRCGGRPSGDVRGASAAAGLPEAGLSPQSEDPEEIQDAVRACSRLFGALLERGELFVGQLPPEETVMAGECPGVQASSLARLEGDVRSPPKPLHRAYPWERRCSLLSLSGWGPCWPVVPPRVPGWAEQRAVGMQWADHPRPRRVPGGHAQVQGVDAPPLPELLQPPGRAPGPSLLPGQGESWGPRPLPALSVPAPQPRACPHTHRLGACLPTLASFLLAGWVGGSVLSRGRSG